MEETVRPQVSLNGKDWSFVELPRLLPWSEALSEFRDVLGLPANTALAVCSPLNEGTQFRRVKDLRDDDKLKISVLLDAAEPGAADGGASASPHAGGSGMQRAQQMDAVDTPSAKKVKTEVPEQSPAAAAAAAFVTPPLPPVSDDDAAIAVADVSDDEAAAAADAAAPTAANTQARPSAPVTGSITIQRSGQVFYEFQPAIDAAQEGDVLVGRGRMVVRGQLRIDKRLGLTGTSMRRPFTLVMEEDTRMASSMLLVTGDGVNLEFVHLLAFGQYNGKLVNVGIVELKKVVGAVAGVIDFELKNCTLEGDNKRLRDDGRITGTMGLIVGEDCEAKTINLHISKTNHAGVYVDRRAKLHATRTHVHGCHGTGWWARMSLEVVMQDCSGNGNSQGGAWLSALVPVELRKCVFNGNAEDGLVLHVDRGLDRGMPQEVWAALRVKAYFARDLEASENGKCGVLIHGVLGADLSRSLITLNGWNGLRVVAKPGEESAAPITVEGARIRSNGRNHRGGATKSNNDFHGCVVEQPSGKAGWRSRVTGNAIVSGHQGPDGDKVFIMTAQARPRPDGM